MAKCRARSASDALQSEQLPVGSYRTGAFTVSLQYGFIKDATLEADGQCWMSLGEEPRRTAIEPYKHIPKNVIISSLPPKNQTCGTREVDG
eukprot:TRINITY_DN9947_c0_g3_i1.p1 TRINITY_DN9947_c0_g3~~TRINITY_DN9947_c0_g3_i1.p1  ORF type:complete len:106 (-),score=6.32 TRINITY_DN9947_c0_g3_i1:221-493(-)